MLRRERSPSQGAEKIAAAGQRFLKRSRRLASRACLFACVGPISFDGGCQRRAVDLGDLQQHLEVREALEAKLLQKGGKLLFGEQKIAGGFRRFGVCSFESEGMRAGRPSG